MEHGIIKNHHQILTSYLAILPPFSYFSPLCLFHLLDFLFYSCIIFCCLFCLFYLFEFRILILELDVFLILDL